jgi:hypothetical protein
MFFRIPCSAIKRMIYKKSHPILRESWGKTQKGMKLVIVSNGACGQHNDVFFISYEQAFTQVLRRYSIYSLISILNNEPDREIKSLLVSGHA